MLLKYLKLQNIRSYISQEIIFPQGSILLSGDIGSGKSTILLCIEFALFGIKRGDLSGEALLRNGKNNGSVELGLVIDNKEIVVNRKLKRTSLGIAQDSGWIMVNGRKKEAAPSELKADILQLMGYPAELLTKGKDILFRYTVYTPQEEMKQIILESKDARLDTLRRVFQIDKYKKIIENSSIIARDMKEKKRELEGKSSDIGQKKRDYADESGQFEIDRLRMERLDPLLKKARDEVARKKVGLAEIEEKAKRFNNIKKEYSMKEIDLINRVDQREKNKAEIEQLEKEISLQDVQGLQEKMKLAEGVKAMLMDKQRLFEESRKSQMAILRSISELKAKIGNHDEIKSKIARLAKCPVCEQEVSVAHKHSINEREDAQIIDLKLSMEKSIERQSMEETAAKKIEAEIEELRNVDRQAEAIKVKWTGIQKDMERQKRLSDSQDRLKREIGAINVAKSSLQQEIEKMGDTESKYKDMQKEVDTALTEEKKIEIEHAGLLRSMQMRQSIMTKLQKEITEKENAMLRMMKISQYVHWLEEFFVKVVGSMEKNVMTKIHSEFNEYFRQWFSMLIEDENLNVRINDEFTPIVEQNGYETEITNLSGGEKTSCALAYRLALNKVINDIVSTIKTKDIIILDEPTDGFSSEQLDRVRDVIEQIGMKQIIIVSHEAKIETFVDNVIRIRKNDHVSEIG